MWFSAIEIHNGQTERCFTHDNRLTTLWLFDIHYFRQRFKNNKQKKLYTGIRSTINPHEVFEKEVTYSKEIKRSKETFKEPHRKINRSEGSCANDRKVTIDILYYFL